MTPTPIGTTARSYDDVGNLVFVQPDGKVAPVPVTSYSEPDPFKIDVRSFKLVSPTEQILKNALGVRAELDSGNNPQNYQGILYLAGPMSGYAEHNFPLFNRVAAFLRHMGWYVLNPAENFEGVAGHPYEVHYLADIKLVEVADTIAFLPGWEKSGGAVGEYVLGDRLNKQLLKVGENEIHTDSYGAKDFYPLTDLRLDSVTFTPFKRNQRNESVLQEADRLVATDRQSQYGHPFDDFTRTAALWTACGFRFFDEKLQVARCLEPEDIALAMMLLKVSRIVNLPKRDSIVDAAGYAKTLDLVLKRREELGKK